MGKEILKKISRRAALACVLAVTVTSTAGCGYSSVDEYLEALGILDPNDYEEESIFSPIEGQSYEPAFVISDDAQVSLNTTEEESSPESEDSSALEVTEQEEFPVHEVETEPAKTQGADKDDLEARAAIGITDESIAAKKKEQEGLYAYDRLTEAGKTLYVEMLMIMEAQGKDITVSTTSDEAVEQVFDYVLMDHPEIFYVDGYSYTNHTLNDVITKITFTGDYLYGIDEVRSRQTRINEYVNKCLAGAPSSEDDYYAIKYVYEYLIDNTEYDLNAEDNQNICSVCLNGRSVCNGYAKTAQYILNKMGIECTLVTGTVDTNTSYGVRHAWNLVRCNDSYYHLDVTWGDSSFQTASGEMADASKLPRINYAYLNVTTADIAINHKVSDLIKIPACNNITDNYYVREGEYFSSAELSLVGDLFSRRYSEGSDNVTIKCANPAIYNQLFDDLITQRKVFDYIQGEDNSQVSYTTFQDTGTIIFWI